MSSGYIIDQDGKFTLVVDGEFTAIRMADGGTIGQAAGPLLTFDDTNDFLEIMGCDVGIGTPTPDAKVEIITTANASAGGGEGIYITAGNRPAQIWNRGNGRISFAPDITKSGNFVDVFSLGDNNLTYEFQSAGGTANFRGYDTGVQFETWGSSAGSITFAPASDAESVAMTISTAGNVGIGATTFGTNAAGTFAMALGTEPTADVANQFALSAFDFAAGNTCPRLRTENGTLIGLNQGLFTTDNVVFVTITSTGGRINNTTRKINTDSPYTVLATDDILFFDTDGGAIEADLPAGIEGTHYKLANCGSSGNDLTVDPNGSEQVYGQAAGAALILADGDVLDIHYNSTEGWW